MSDAVIISLISALGLVLSGVLVELVRTRRKLPDAGRVDQLEAATAKIVAQVTNNGGGSMKDAVDAIRSTVDKIRDTQVAHGERLAKVEVRLDDHLQQTRR